MLGLHDRSAIDIYENDDPAIVTLVALLDAQTARATPVLLWDDDSVLACTALGMLAHRREEVA